MDNMAGGSSGRDIPYKLITFIVAIVILVIGGVLIGEVIKAIISSIHATELIAGIVLAAAGMIILSIMITQWYRNR